MRNLLKSQAARMCCITLSKVDFYNNGHKIGIGFDVLCPQDTGWKTREGKNIAATFEPVWEGGKPLVLVHNRIGHNIPCWIAPNDMASMLADLRNVIYPNSKPIVLVGFKANSSTICTQ